MGELCVKKKGKQNIYDLPDIGKISKQQGNLLLRLLKKPAKAQRQVSTIIYTSNVLTRLAHDSVIGSETMGRQIVSVVLV